MINGFSLEFRSIRARREMIRFRFTYMYTCVIYGLFVIRFYKSFSHLSNTITDIIFKVLLI